MTISLTSGETTHSNAVRVSSAASLALPQQTDGPQTRAGIQEPAAVVSKSLEKLNSAAAEARIAMPAELRTRGNGATHIEDSAGVGQTDRIHETPEAFAEQVQTDITTSAEIAVLAQAQQLPAGPMPYSGDA